MSFLKNLTAAVQPKIIESEFDFGGEIGNQPIRLRPLSYAQRQDIFVKRLDKDGKLDITGSALMMNAELIATTLIGDDNKPVANTEGVKTWDAGLVDRLADHIGKALGLLDAKKEGEENPSTP